MQLQQQQEPSAQMDGAAASRGPGHTLEQRRAAAILGKVHGLGNNAKVKQEYRRLVERLPVMILTNGLGQTLAYLSSRHGDANGDRDRIEAFRLVSGHLHEMIVDERGLYPNGQGDLLHQLIKGNRQQLRQATDEALAVLSWWTKFVRAFLPKPEGEDH